MKIWAYHTDAGVWENAHGWRAIQFSGLPGVRATMSATHVYSREIQRLGIVAHGDSDGVVQITPHLTYRTYSRFRDEFRRLGQYLAHRAFVEFYACNAGAGSRGRALLQGISELLPGRTIVGFEISGAMERSGIRNPAGGVRPAANAGSIEAGVYLTPTHRNARWARNGMLIREGLYQRGPHRRCGNPDCPGHELSLHHCEGWADTVPR